MWVALALVVTVAGSEAGGAREGGLGEAGERVVLRGGGRERREVAVERDRGGRCEKRDGKQEEQAREQRRHRHRHRHGDE